MLCFGLIFKIMSEKRFHNYSGLDLLFQPIASKLVPIFINLNISANQITLLSGF